MCVGLASAVVAGCGGGGDGACVWEGGDSDSGVVELLGVAVSGGIAAPADSSFSSCWICVGGGCCFGCCWSWVLALTLAFLVVAIVCMCGDGGRRWQGEQVGARGIYV